MSEKLVKEMARQLRVRFWQLTKVMPVASVPDTTLPVEIEEKNLRPANFFYFCIIIHFYSGEWRDIFSVHLGAGSHRSGLHSEHYRCVVAHI